MTDLNLSVDKTVAKGSEIVKFTAKYPGKVNKNILLLEKGLTDSAVGNANTDSSGIAVIEWKGSTQGLHTFYAVHSIIPGISACGLWCDRSNEVSVSIKDAPCDPWDIACRTGEGASELLTFSPNTKLIAAAVIILVVLIAFFWVLGTPSTRKG